jgi:dTDP-4-dehydrorhamnose reductase
MKEELEKAYDLTSPIAIIKKAPLARFVLVHVSTNYVLS